MRDPGSQIQIRFSHPVPAGMARREGFRTPNRAPRRSAGSGGRRAFSPSASRRCPARRYRGVTAGRRSRWMSHQPPGPPRPRPNGDDRSENSIP
jgi:hypothetical protein